LHDFLKFLIVRWWLLTTWKGQVLWFKAHQLIVIIYKLFKQLMRKVGYRLLARNNCLLGKI
jgi:hypothetical protein